MDWNSLWQFQLSPWELVVRGTAIYWFLFIVFRVVLRRDVGSIAIADVLLLVLIADAAQNGMAGDYRSISEAFVLIATIIGWNVLLNWLTFRFAPLRRMFEPTPLPLILNGEIQWRNMRREFMTKDELLSELREHGVESPAQVKRATMESNGTVSVIKREPGPAEPAPSRGPKGAGA